MKLLPGRTEHRSRSRQGSRPVHTLNKTPLARAKPNQRFPCLLGYRLRIRESRQSTLWQAAIKAACGTVKSLAETPKILELQLPHPQYLFPIVSSKGETFK